MPELKSYRDSDLRKRAVTRRGFHLQEPNFTLFSRFRAATAGKRDPRKLVEKFALSLLSSLPFFLLFFLSDEDGFFHRGGDEYARKRHRERGV